MSTRTDIVRREAGGRRFSFLVIPAARGLAIVGTALILLNVVGLFFSLRAPEIDSYADFAGSSTLGFDSAMSRLAALSSTDRRQFVTEATRVFHEGMAHVWPEDIDKNGLDHYRMRIPVWENYLLYALSYLKPDTYRDYELCDYRKALERGTGRCGQQSMALVGFLSEHGIPTGFVALGGHAIATAEVSEGEWYMLDPDYGGVIPFDLATAEKNPASVKPYYWSQAAAERMLHERFQPEHNEIRYGGTEARYGRACPIERIAYISKWALPIVLVAPWLLIALLGRRTRESLSS